MITTDKAFERLIFTITKQNKPNQTDLEALKVIAEYVENSKKQEIRNNYLFAKMYVYNFIHEIMHFKDSFLFNYKTSQLNLHSFLKIPLEVSLEIMRTKVNTHEYSLFCENIGMSKSYIRNKQEQENDKELMKKNSDDFTFYSKGVFNKEQFEKKMTDQIVYAINQYKTLP